ncbi:MAG: 2Fe-2S iron-sulfur cluster-binding protein [Cyclobacteriaceae bacterium]|nr:(2Fe-2S)-binding protein [Flammeovirgaceae bacterium]MCZ8023008.1 2Fe-2S iron-sulfur cluster-binding protein [Cytophagales bacterium]MCZ8326650.1 2Fe-2S iron-sulfur cluster-binding protein [Cyclobacteriaceae bacterium]
MNFIIQNLDRNITVANTETSLLLAIHQSGTDWMQSCGGKGRCTTCKFAVLSGVENISALSPAEKKYRQQGALLQTERLACQVRLTGDVTALIPKESKLPHINYLDGNIKP